MAEVWDSPFSEDELGARASGDNAFQAESLESYEISC